MALWYDCGQGLIKTSFARSDLGADAYLCCPGPSLASVDATALDRPGIVTFALNTAYPHIRPRVWMGLDHPSCYDTRLWWEPFVKIVRMHTVNGVDLTLCGGQHVRYCPNVFFPDLEEAPAEKMFSLRAHDVQFIWEKNTLAFALHVMIWMGARRIRLVGCDFGGDRDYYDDRRLTDEQRTSNRRLYTQQVEMLRELHPIAARIGIEIISCTPGSPVNEFMPFVPLADAIEESCRRVPASRRSVLHADDAEWCRWGLATEEAGVVVGCAPSQEWLLGWWWENYSRRNRLPVMFADFGLSAEAKAWCGARGRVVDLSPAPATGWLRKPFAILRAPFERILWTDLDVEIRGDVQRLLTPAERGRPALHPLKGPILPDDQGAWRKTMPPEARFYCTSVVAVVHGEELVDEWARAVLDRSLGYVGDHEAMSHLIHLRQQPVHVFAPEECVSRTEGTGAAAVHWGGWGGKKLLKERLTAHEVARSHCEWRQHGLIDTAGVLVGCDARQESLLEWWWDHYARQNSYPVTFADYGMTAHARAWCAERGPIIDLDRGFLDDSTKHPFKTTFLKPFALLKSYYTQTLMMDLDCEVRGPLGPLFAVASKGCALREDRFDRDQPGGGAYQSGVIVVRHGHPLIPEYAAWCRLHWRTARGDQSALNAVIGPYTSEIDVMPPAFHWLRLEGENPAAIVVHWTGPEGKTRIQEAMRAPDYGKAVVR